MVEISRYDVVRKAAWYAYKAKEYAAKVDVLESHSMDWKMSTRYMDMYSALVQLLYGFDEGIKMEDALMRECLDLRK